LPVTRRGVPPRAFIDFPFKYGFGIILLLNSRSVPLCGPQVWVFFPLADVAQSAEHPPCKRAVTSSILVVGSTRAIWKVNNLLPGRLPKWPKGTDCKSVVRRLRRFESFTAHYPARMRDSTKRAHIAQSVEHTLGKGEVTGPNPVVGSVAEKFYVCEKEKETWRRRSMTGANRI
jgi:hypothetical protein